MRDRVLDLIYSADSYNLVELAQAVAEYCAGVCEEMGTHVAGCDNGKPTKIADDCADWIRRDFGLKIQSCGDWCFHL